MGGVNSEVIYSYTYFGTKHLVDDYVSETIHALEYVARSDSMTLDAKMLFFRNLTKIYGRSALCLSGGATLGYYHIGVVKALFETHSLPLVITGASAGSLVAAMVCCRTDDELKQEIFNAEVLQPRLIALADSFTVRSLKTHPQGPIQTIPSDGCHVRHYRLDAKNAMDDQGYLTTCHKL